MENFSVGLQKDLIELINLQETYGVQSGVMMGSTAGFPGEGKIGELFRRAREIANKHHPQSFTVSVGIPFGAQVSFTVATDTGEFKRGVRPS